MEIIFKYLNGETSHGSFRKTILETNSLDNLIDSNDLYTIKNLSISYSKTNEIRKLLIKNINKSEYELYRIGIIEKMMQRERPDFIILYNKITSYKPEDSRRFQSNQKFRKKYSLLVTNIPSQEEAKLWNPIVYQARREELEKEYDQALKDCALTIREMKLELESKSWTAFKRLIEKIKNII